MAIQTLTLNVNAQPSAEDRAFLYLSQNENGRDIRFRVLGDDLPSGCTATLSGVKPDGNVWSKAGTVTNNFVVVEEDVQMTAVAGRWDAQLDIVNGSKNIVTALIRITVEAAAVEAGAVPSDTQLEGYVEQCKQYAETAKDEAYGSPLTAATAAAMTDQKRVYVYTGSETGYTAGHWYYYDGSAWTDGGVYNAVAVDTDTTLSIAGKAADAKETGDQITELKSGLSEMTTATAEDVGKVLKAKTVADGKVTEWEFGEAGGGSDITVPTYDATKAYPVGSYVMYNGQMYRSNAPITTAEAWTATHWDVITASDLIADMNTRLDMLVTMQEVVEEEDEPVEGITQLLNPSDFTWVNPGGTNNVRIKEPHVPYVGDGAYYPNPAKTTDGSAVNQKMLYYAKFYDAYNNQLTLTKLSDSSTHAYITIFGTTYNAYIVIENARTIKLYARGTLASTYTASADIAWFGGTGSFVGYFGAEGENWGITYGGSSETYVPYEGAEPSEPTYEYQYVPQMAEYVQAYMKTQGTAVTNNMFNFVYPEKDNSEFVNAVKYYHERSDRQRNNIIRIGSFNKFVSRGQSNWSTIKQELADYSLDICGFQECAAIQSGGVITTQIGSYLQGWQFGGYAVQDTVVDKAIVSHWAVTHTDLITLLTYDNGAGTSNCIHALMSIPTDAWYSNAIDTEATLSVYCYHGKSSGATIGGTSYSSLQVRQMEINALLTILANDTSDFIVIVGDTNCFESGFDATTGTHTEWEMFRNAGYTPVLDGHDSTVTGATQNMYYFKIGNEVHCLCAYDQIFIGANITAKRFGIVDSNLYPVESLGGVPVSDHCMVYADLKFDFDAVQQAKLRNIAVTEKWW